MSTLFVKITHFGGICACGGRAGRVYWYRALEAVISVILGGSTEMKLEQLDLRLRGLVILRGLLADPVIGK